MREKLNLFFTFIILLVLASSCSKDSVETDEVTSSISSQNDYDVSEDLATTVAKKFSKSQVFSLEASALDYKTYLKSSQSDSGKEIKSIVTFRDDNSKPLIYVFQFDSVGFVIVSGTKKEDPILAYSETGVFDYDSTSTENSAFKDWITIRKNRINELRNDTSISISEDTEDLWEASAPASDDEEIVSGGSVAEQVGPLLSTTWGQGCGYNALLDDCPGYTTRCEKMPTGCDVVAMAQIMRYWECPSDYDWSLMPDNSASDETAILMRDLGAMIIKSYTCTGSSSSLSLVRSYLISDFGFSSSAKYVDYDESTVVSQLKIYGRPVLLRGTDTTYGGHAWICDGYKRTKYITIHNPDTYYEYETYKYSKLYLDMNWGWSGANDGWYLYNDFSPSTYDYESNQKMVVNIYL